MNKQTIILPVEKNGDTSFNLPSLELLLLLFIEVKAYTSPVNRTGSPRGFSQVQISHKLNTK